MSSSRLYYTDSTLSTFTAVVTMASTVEGRPVVGLDRTAFYPTSGGQPFDTGMLNGVRVVDVIDGEDGGVMHVLEAPLAVGTGVDGVIDWSRRFDHMQQHTGQHVLSAAFDNLFGVRTESFHLGAEVASIDLAREVTAAEMARAEDEANRIVWEDRPVTVRFVSADEARTLPLRKEPAREGTLRLVDVEGFDLSACGGTHVGRTGSIGVIAVSGWEKVRGGTRVEFLCGGRVPGKFREWRDALGDVRRRLSVAPAELADAVDRLQAENKALARGARDVQERLAVHEGRALAARGMRAGSRVVVVEAVDGWDAGALKALAAAAAAEPDVVAVLFSTADSRAFVAARHPNVTDVDAGRLVRELTVRLGGRGGGKPDLAQGGGLTASIDDCLTAARALLSEGV